MRKTRIPGDALREKHGFVYRQLLEEFFRALMGIEHSKLQIEDRLTRHREIEMAGLDDSGMNRPHGHLKDAFTQSGPVDVAFSLERRQHGLERKVLAQGMNIGPIVMQGDPARIGVSDGLQAKPILDFALLPVHRGQFGGERRKLEDRSARTGARTIRYRASPLLFKYVVVEENAFRGTPVLGEHRNQPGFELASQVFGESANVRIAEKKIDFIFAVRRHRLNLRAKLLLKSLKECRHCLPHRPPITMSAAP